MLRLSSLILLVSSSLFAAQEIAFTFDDAPRESTAYYTGTQRASALLAQIQKAQIPQVYFFAIGKNLNEEGKARLKKYAEAGHKIANHSFTHRRPEEIGVKKYIEDFKKAHTLLSPLLNFAPWYRFPYLDEGKTAPVRDAIREALADMKYSTAHVTVDNSDWRMDYRFQLAVKEKKPLDLTLLKNLYVANLVECIEFYDKLGVRALGRNVKHVMLLHENDLAALFLSDLVQTLRASGWNIISVDEAWKDPITNMKPKALPAGNSILRGLAKDKGIPAKETTTPAEDEDYIDSIFDKLGI